LLTHQFATVHIKSTSKFQQVMSASSVTDGLYLLSQSRQYSGEGDEY